MSYDLGLMETKIDLGHGDISFIVEEDCKEKEYLIKKIENG